MQRLLLSPCFWFIPFVCAAQSAETPIETPLNRVEKSIRAALQDVEDELTFEYPKSYPGTLIVNCRTRTFTIHGQSKDGEYQEETHETVGPSYRGFQLRLSLQAAGTVNAAVVPQTIRRPYWTTDLDIRLLKGTKKQLYCRLSYGSRLLHGHHAEKDLLKQVRKAVSELGTAPYLQRERTSEK